MSWKFWKFWQKPWKPKRIMNLWEHQKGWGWNVYFFDWERRRLVGHHPYIDLWDVGTEVRAKMRSGEIARFKVVKFEPQFDPKDMFFATLEDVGYLEKGDKKEPT